MGTFRVLVTDRLSVKALERLKAQVGLDVRVNNQGSLKTSDLADIHAMLIRSKTTIDKRLLDQATELKFIVTATSGFDHIDVLEAVKREIHVTFVPQANTQSAAELTIGLMLSCARKLKLAQAAVDSGNWDRNPLMGMELQNKTLGILGLGRVGSKVSKIATAIGMEVLAFDPYITDEAFKQAGAKRSGRDEVYKMCDILTLHLPYTKETHHLINEKTLDVINHGIMLINTSRGKILVEPDIIAALKQGRIESLGLDVFEKEPLALKSSLIKHPKVVLSPHIGANTAEAFERASQSAVDKILAFREGGEPDLDRLTKETLCLQL